MLSTCEYKCTTVQKTAKFVPSLLGIIHDAKRSYLGEIGNNGKTCTLEVSDV